jgi:GR25 family glycosyltransferase involved in LPS biosynthesis
MREYAKVPTLCRRRRTFWARLTPGAVACALSHRQVWEWFGDSPDLGDAVLVLEDDATLCSDFAVHLATIAQQLASKASWRFCLLGSHELGQTLLSRRASLASRDLQQGQQSSGLFAYLLHRRALPLLLGPRGPFPLSEQLDAALCDLEWGELASPS